MIWKIGGRNKKKKLFARVAPSEHKSEKNDLENVEQTFLVKLHICKG